MHKFPRLRFTAIRNAIVLIIPDAFALQKHNGQGPTANLHRMQSASLQCTTGIQEFRALRQNSSTTLTNYISKTKTNDVNNVNLHRDSSILVHKSITAPSSILIQNKKKKSKHETQNCISENSVANQMSSFLSI